MNRPLKQELSSFFNNLVCVVKALEGQYTTIDLRGESSVTGKITFVDGFMNVDMTDCVYYDPRGNTYPFHSFFVKKRNIRYVHIPDGLSATELAEKQMDALRYNKNRQGKPQNKALFRKKRSEKYQREILEEIASTSQRQS